MSMIRWIADIHLVCSKIFNSLSTAFRDTFGGDGRVCMLLLFSNGYFDVKLLCAVAKPMLYYIQCKKIFTNQEICSIEKLWNCIVATEIFQVIKAKLATLDDLCSSAVACEIMKKQWK
ncbi:hypothetical protein HNY73_012824 [Argiope bruennichi]|uniref:Uncharacterized protein n=1 Tax=Argiope bruennichi TaxID=94029 RepID=A0A8T0EW50_ARGBR|nr:hypothetical protein HNY73_012824 [Argiope bruennichi]